MDLGMLDIVSIKNSHILSEPKYTIAEFLDVW